MSTEQRRPAELWFVMQARRLGLGRNPMRRRSDRWQSVLIVLALVAGLLMVPIGAETGTSILNSSEQRAEQQRGLLQQVQATTTEDAPALTGQEIGQVTWPVGVVWQDAAGGQRSSRADVVLGTRAGSVMTLWLDRSGRVVKSPRTAGESGRLGGVAGLGIVVGGWLVLWILVVIAARCLDRRRFREWEAEWAQFAPRWTDHQT